MRRFSILATCLLVILMTTVALAQTSTTTPPTQGKPGKLSKSAKKQNKKIGKALGKIDQDHDGKISRTEWNRKPKAFDQVDTNKDGFISREELLAFRQQHRTR